MEINKKISELSIVLILLVIVFFGQTEGKFFKIKSVFGYGGGGGLPLTANNPPVAPPEGFSVVINNDASETDSPIVTLTLNGGPDTERMAISNFSDFQGAIQEHYQATKTWTLTEGEEEKTVYVKFYTGYGHSSDIVSDSIDLVTILPSPLIPEAQNTDANDDDRIDILDFNILMVNWGLAAKDNVADFNSDGAVDIFDFNLLMIYWT